MRWFGRRTPQDEDRQDEAISEADLLAASSLFDEDWYARRTGFTGTRAAGVADYLARPLDDRPAPHPLFLADHVSAELERRSDQTPEDTDPLVAYLGGGHTFPTHPLFDAAAYAARTPGAEDHPGGPFGHYLQADPTTRAQGADWLPEAHPDLVDWVVAQHDTRRDSPQAVVEDVLDRARPTTAPRRQDLTSVVVSTDGDWSGTSAAARAVLAAADEHPEHGEVDVVLVDHGCEPGAAAVLASLPLRDHRVRVVHLTGNPGRAAAANVGFAASGGAHVVFLHPDTRVATGWLAPLVEALRAPEVLGAQSLLLDPDGTIRCAGVLAPDAGGVPYPLLRGFPEADAAGLASVRLPALSGAALALRAADVDSVRGFDPALRDGAEDVDLCLRLLALRAGHFVCVRDSVAVHASPRDGEPPIREAGRRVDPDRWVGRGPDGETEVWHALGYDVLGHEPASDRQGHEGAGSGPSTLPLLRRRRLQVSESPPRLRWALKNPAPAGRVGDRWGDTHFASSLAAGLRSLGQEVVVDRRPAHDRPSGCHDDVDLVLRGLAPYRPTADRVSLCWVISHPDMFEPVEAARYDRVLAASETWAAEQGRTWGLRIDPLLQATDPSLFHPDLGEPDTGDPILFVGSSRGVPRPLVMAAVERGLPLSIYGPQWRPLVPRRYIKARYLDNAEVGAAYRRAGVVLNDHWEDMRRLGFVSNRLFDAAAAGARVITDDVGALPAEFGRSVQVLRDLDDLAGLTSLPRPDDVFGTDDERRAVADAVARRHSFAARAARLVEVALEVRRQRGLL